MNQVHLGQETNYNFGKNIYYFNVLFQYKIHTFYIKLLYNYNTYRI